MASSTSVRERLQIAAVQGLLAHGPGVSVEAIAELAGVGRRTAFRYFPTRDELLASGVEWIVDGYVAQMPERGARPVEQWLRDLARASAAFVGHSGPGYLALVANDWQSDAMRDVMARRASSRRTFSEQVALEAWRGAGRRGRPPLRLVRTCLLCLGPFVHYGLRIDGDVDADEAGRVAGDLLVDVFRAVTATNVP